MLIADGVPYTSPALASLFDVSQLWGDGLEIIQQGMMLDPTCGIPYSMLADLLRVTSTCNRWSQSRRISGKKEELQRAKSERVLKRLRPEVILHAPDVRLRLRLVLEDTSGVS